MDTIKTCKECYQFVQKRESVFCSSNCYREYMERPFQSRWGLSNREGAVKMKNGDFSQEERDNYEEGLDLLREYRHDKVWGLV